MANKFLNKKILKTCLCKDLNIKLEEVLKTYVNHQKTVVVTSKNFYRKNLNYYNDLLKSFNGEVVEVFLSNNDTRYNIKKILRNIDIATASVVAICEDKFFNSIKIASFIKKIPYILCPTKVTSLNFMLSRAYVNNNGYKKPYLVNPPLAVLIDNGVVTKNKQSLISSFADLVSYQFYLLDNYLNNLLNGKTLQNSSLLKLQQIINQTLILEEKLYNFENLAVNALIKNIVKAGLIVEAQNLFIDATSLFASAVKALPNTPLKTTHYKLISSLFLINIYSSFISNIKPANYKGAYLEGVNPNQALSYNSNGIENKLLYYKINEYKKEITSIINSTKINLNKGFTIFKRMSLPLSFVIEQLIEPKQIKKAIALSPYVHANTSLINYINNFGILNFDC